MTMSNSMVMKLMMVVKDYNDVRLYVDEADEGMAVKIMTMSNSMPMKPMMVVKIMTMSNCMVY